MKKPRASMKRRRVVKKPAASPTPIAGVVHVATPPGTIPVVAHDPGKGRMSVIHVEPDKIKETGWLRWLFG